ncbi:MAG: Asp-tRNA(Asn)/Glu-tRNA(Gln) amidotransferase subunit GatB [Actinobacteria bacterium]|nr:Asp-tRNA(Asn)/Glu-tRNA(Gln) amidotransferase subunit GatB [Actinomycetota bacterium]
MTDGWELVVGLEVHVELSTASKMFCGCATDFGAPPNTRVCPVCTGQPGALPVANAAAVESAARLGLALNCAIAPTCWFHRKNYFYPDLAKNYQISQYDIPLCSDGWLDLDTDGDPSRIGIERVHMEEDTGKMEHRGGGGRLHGAEQSLIDYNRCGIPLLECVSRPDIRSPEQAGAFVRELQGIVRTLGISDAKMEEGSLRCDVNVSVRRVAADGTSEPYGTRCEIKNLNSTRSLVRAVAYEAERQIHVLESAGQIVQETRHWDEERGLTELLRRKEAVTDYRYFPDPDLVEVVSSAAWVEQLHASLPELPATARGRLVEAGVDGAQAATIVSYGLLAWYDEAVAGDADPRTTANWLTGEVVAQLNERGAEPADTAVTGHHIGELVRLVDDETLSHKLGREVLDAVFETGAAPTRIVEERGIQQISDEAALDALVERIIADNPDTAATIREGNTKAIGALVGQVMRETRGRANPQLVNQLLADRILGG